ncbi:PrpF domain-containing protein [Shigella flexneri]
MFEKNTLRDDERWNLGRRFLLAEHLPEDQTQRDKILMAIMGSGNDLEIDGIGGGNPLTR